MLSDRLNFNSQAAAKDIGPNLFVWGSNLSGTLGLGDTIKRSSPVQLAGTWTHISSTGYHSFGQKQSGLWYGWGFNTKGCLGIGDSQHRSSPVLLAGTWLSIKPGFGSSTFGLRPDGSLWSWGYGHVGCLGLGDTVSRSSPVQIAGTWKEMTPTSYHGMAIRSDGSLWSWGYGARGATGLGDVVARSSPVQIVGTWISLPNQFARYRCGGGIKHDGSLFMWGNNEFGEGGIGSLGNISSPTQIAGTWRKLTESSAHSMAIRHDGTLWAWGDGAGGGNGALGVGDTIARSSPIQVGAGQWSDVSSETVGMSLGITATGALFVWGNNANGKLGLGDTIKRSSPVQLAGTWKSALGGYALGMGLKF